MTQTVICMKWGTLYGPEYANRLYGMVARNTNRPLRFICFTDDASGLRSEIEALPLPEIKLPENLINMPWRKMALWGEDLAGLSGNVLFLDLDLLITGSIDPFFDSMPEEEFVVIHNWTSKPKPIGNTSCFRFRVGMAPYLKANLEADPEGCWKKYRIEQTMISKQLPKIAFWPDDWCVSFKHSLLPIWPLRIFTPAKLPVETKVVAFTGKPDVHDVIAGKWPEKKRWKRIYKVLRKPSWVEEYWRE